MMSKTLTLIIFITALNEISGLSCRDGWYNYHDERCFKGFIEDVTWDEARQRCQVQGGNLAQINEPLLNTFITQTLLPIVTTHGNDDQWLDGTYFWIGARRNDMNKFNFIEGDPVDSSLNVWAENEPDNGGGWGYEEDCVGVFVSNDFSHSLHGKWADLVCDEFSVAETGYICEISLNRRDGIVIGDTFYPTVIGNEFSFDNAQELQKSHNQNIKLWPHCRIPIKLDRRFSNKERRLLRNVMKNISRIGCIKFGLYDNTTDTDYVNILREQ